jgi:DNA-binding transcriptional MocR family regulator
MDTENRVIRLDTFSKIFSGGLRTGVLTGPKEIVRVVEMHMQASVLHTSSLSQVYIRPKIKTSKFFNYGKILAVIFVLSVYF